MARTAAPMVIIQATMDRMYTIFLGSAWTLEGSKLRSRSRDGAPSGTLEPLADWLLRESFPMSSEDGGVSVVSNEFPNKKDRGVSSISWDGNGTGIKMVLKLYIVSETRK
jgi:hypothetical protein